MSLPDSRNTVYAALSQLQSADLNDLQDMIIDLYAEKPLLVPASLGVPNGTWIFNQHAESNGGTALVVMLLGLQVGDRIMSVDVRLMTADGDDDIVVQLGNSVDDTDNALASETSTGSGWQTVTLDGSSSTPLTVPHTVVEGVYYVLVSGCETGDVIANVVVNRRQPAPA